MEWEKYKKKPQYRHSIATVNWRRERRDEGKKSTIKS